MSICFSGEFDTKTRFSGHVTFWTGLFRLRNDYITSLALVILDVFGVISFEGDSELLGQC
jgi:hypothetical protein